MRLKRSALGLAFGLAIFGYLVHLFTSTIPRQDSDLIHSTGMLVTLDQLRIANNWPPPPPLETPYQTYNVWNVGKCVFNGQEV